LPLLPPEHLKALSTRLFVALGATADEARVVAEHLVNSNLAGHDSHGVLRIPQYAKMIEEKRIVPGAPIEVERDTPTMTVLNGHWGFGQFIAKRAFDIAMGKARNSAISCVAAHNCNHVGRVGEYTEMVAAQGMIGIAMVNNHGGGQVMCPHGGTAKRLSPNPISVAFPTGASDPILLDITSSVVAEGKLRVKRNRGEKIPLGWVTDAQGRPTTDPNDFYKDPPGAILPFGGMAAHKGFGLAFVIDVLCGTLSGAGCSRPGVPHPANGLFGIVIDIQKFLPLTDFRRQVDALIQHVKSSPLAPGFTEILVPGEPEHRERQKRMAEGIFVEDETWRQITEVATKVGLRL